MRMNSIQSFGLKNVRGLISCACLAVAIGNLPAALLGGQPDVKLPPSESAAKSKSESSEPEEISEPERIARLQRTIKEDTNRLQELKRQLDDPESDFAKGEAAFNKLDAQVKDQKKAVQQALDDNDQPLAEKLQSEQAALEKKWTLAKDEFQLAIEQRKTRQESITTLELKIGKDQQALDRLRGKEPPEATPPTKVSEKTPPEFEPKTLPTKSPEENPVAPPTAEPNTPPPPNGEGKSLLGKSKPDPRVSDAEKVAAQSAAAAKKAEDNAESIAERIEILRQDIELERKLRAVAIRKIRLAEEQRTSLDAQLEQKQAAGESDASVRKELRQAEAALAEARSESDRISDHLDELQTALSSLQSEQVAALQDAEQKRQEAEAAQRAVAALNSPFSVHNMTNWLASHGVSILVILAALAAALWAGALLESRLVSWLAVRSKRGDQAERENRAKTLVSVLHNALRTVAIGTAAMMVLEECGVPVGPILGGAAVIGLAVAFGAQSLIKDYFTGFMVLMEQQYMIGDVVTIGNTTATVERITLRITVLRDLKGRVHFIPHGQITTVTNLTHEWSRAVFDIGIAYKEDADAAMEVLLELGRELRADPKFSWMILEDPIMLGVDDFADSAVVIRLTMKTRPLSQWEVKREMLRRIKRRFDELGIEIPFPHRTIYFANSPDLPPADTGEPEA